MPFVDSVKSEILTDYFGSSATKMGTPIDVALSTTEPNSDGTGVTEPSVGGYSRVSVANTDAEWSHSTAGDYVENINEIDFGEATADWGEIGWFVLYVSGTAKFWGFITNIDGEQTTKDVLDGQRFFFIAGGLKIQFPPILAA